MRPYCSERVEHDQAVDQSQRSIAGLSLWMILLLRYWRLRKHWGDAAEIVVFARAFALGY
jgi:hypothetical protein